MIECSECHALFSHRDVMMRHKRLKHGDNDEGEDIDMTDVSPTQSDTDSDAEEDNIVFRQMAHKARKHTAAEWQKRYEKYLNQNMSEKKASKKADEKTKGETYQQFRKLYERFLYDQYQLQEDTTHEQVTDAIDEFVSDNHGLKKSIKMALRKNKYLLESYLDKYDNDEDEEEDKEEDEEEED
ncbi:glutamic acid-rich protein-like [Ostrea edulis]|uniref:glutamic acid-rich protein-like n=1 Tax=Ostrea edulis TaxID=37623 RepID=UPI0024AEAFB2|nr:glutamic acid-rich protein-like [Ostrea edulis]